ncbi:DNA-3-methyladenine glycosylase [Youngiibacter fragilis]|uniref:Putative 3-methyladenine DNA glycosylase n=1 Tax=Youngiibacter fragilis 232.1 TaxID=994573 RepID=V7I1K0_9CLOT|nr:DNA-3-methyladenine glycosylase [Youngiibacter fragilis]ETA78902.1 3-methyladenine DNA glycosylase [Youngiibacter fragilis 232.1]
MSGLKTLGNDFFERDARTVAIELLGKVIEVRDGDICCSAVITETESYSGFEDKASHAFGGRVTDRNRVMYGKSGIIYVYLVYGMHVLLNIVTGEEGFPAAVLIRSALPKEGIPTMAERRFGKRPEQLTGKQLASLAIGPGNLTKALGITMEDYGFEINGICGQRSISLFDSGFVPEYYSSPRIGVGYAEEWAEVPWRFSIRDGFSKF